MVTEDYYQILGVSHEATEKEIRQAYHRMIKLYHPDLNPDLPDAESRIKAVLVAFETLGNQRRRADYDKIMRLFGPSRRSVVATQSPVSAPVSASRLEMRRREARRPVLAWLVVVLVVILSYCIWQSDHLSRRLFHHWSIIPTIYSSTIPKSSNPAEVFEKEPVEDRWYLWYRKFEYQLFGGNNGSARELAEAYASAAKDVLTQGRKVDALAYASLAAAVDPTDKEALELLRTLKRDTAARVSP